MYMKQLQLYWVNETEENIGRLLNSNKKQFHFPRPTQTKKVTSIGLQHMVSFCKIKSKIFSCFKKKNIL